MQNKRVVDALSESLNEGVNACAERFFALTGLRLYGYEIQAETIPSGELRATFKIRIDDGSQSQ